MANLKWLDAIVQVMEEEKRVLHYNEIAELISEKKLREKLGATPANSVNVTLNDDINEKGNESIFVKTGRGEFILKKFIDEQLKPTNGKTIGEEKVEDVKLINAFGIYWSRDKVHWKPSLPDLLGIQQVGASIVNFKEQIGIYLLHDNRETIYVGQASEQKLGQRLKNHTTDRLSGRWERFSWFGLYPVQESGQLDTNYQPSSTKQQVLVDTLEAILIEAIEPRQNRKQGNTFSGMEYLQQEAPEIQKKKKEELLRELTDKL